MPPEDKLTHDERLRLECLAQAVASCTGHVREVSSGQILEKAEQFQEFLLGKK